MTVGHEPAPKATVELEATDVISQFDELFDAVEATESAQSTITTKVETERELGRRVQILPDGVSVVEVGDDTLKEVKSIDVNLAHVLGVDSSEHRHDLNAVVLAGLAESLNLTPELVEKLEGIAAKLDLAIEGKQRFLEKAKQTGSYRGTYETSGDPWLYIKRTTKKDGSVLMGALLGGTLTNHVNLSDFRDTDDLWNDGMTTHEAIKVPLGNAMQFVKEKIG